MTIEDIKKPTENYLKLSQKLCNSWNLLNYEYLISRNEKNENTRQCVFAFDITKVILESLDLFTYATKHDITNLIDSLQTHRKKYKKLLDMHVPNISDFFESNITNIISFFEKMEKNTFKDLSSYEQEEIKEHSTLLIHKCKRLFSEQSHNNEVFEQIHAFAIAFSIDELTLQQKLMLADQLLLVKELWQIDNIKKESGEDFREIFLLNPSNILKNFEFLDVANAFWKITEILTDEHEILIRIRDDDIMHLYDRLKNFDIDNAAISSLLRKVHHEAQFRYNYNILSDSGYELLRRFQSYEAISHQIESSEFTLAETFLLKHDKFLREVIIFIAKHIDNIRAVAGSGLNSLNNIIHRIKAELQRMHMESNDIANILNSAITKLKYGMNNTVLNRYCELDKFEISSLKSRYCDLFTHISHLLDDNKNQSSFLEQVIVRKLSQDYHTITRSNSISKLRVIAKERIDIAEQLSEIDFVELFSHDNLNKIFTLNLKNKMIGLKITNSSDYVKIVIRTLLHDCTASQLESLYRPILSESKLSKTKEILKTELVAQIKARTTIPKMLYSIMTGKKSEFNKLKSIKKSIGSVDNN